MNIKTVVALAALAAVTALPLSANAQGQRGRDSGQNRESRQGQNDQRRNDSRNQNDRRREDNSRQNDQRQRDDQRWRPDQHHQGNDQRQRDDDRRRAEERRREDQRRWDEQRRREEQQRRWEEDRRREEERRREQERNRHNRDRNYGYDGGYSRNDDRYYDRGRSNGNQNQWRDIAIAAGAIGIIGLLEHDDFLTFSGATGALYALSRYENDRDCNDSFRRTRAQYFSLPYFYRDGHRYERRVVTRGNNRYYQFARCD